MIFLLLFMQAALANEPSPLPSPSPTPTYRVLPLSLCIAKTWPGLTPEELKRVQEKAKCQKAN